MQRAVIIIDKIIDSLPYWLLPKKRLFADHRRYTLDATEDDKHRIFVDRGSDVLFVAHLDTVLPPKLIRYRKTKKGKIKRIYAHGLDDRLGCAIAAVLSKKLGVDLLLTDHEEKCRSTAEYHDLKNYNWIAEFDREGEDVVTYDMDSTEFCEVLADFWIVGLGSFSDLCSMQTTACCVNIGIGHKYSHSKDSFVDIKVMRKQIEKFLTFYQLYAGVKFEQDYKADKFGYSDYLCDFCGFAWGMKVYGYKICDHCFESMIEQVMYKQEV